MTMVTVFLIVVGILALKGLKVDLYPNVSYPVLVVRSSLSGAAPEEIEQLITRKIEDSLSTVAGISTLRSVSREGVSIVIMEFSAGVDVRFQEIQVRGKIANLRASLPDDMKEPEIFRQDPDDTPIIELAITGDRTPAEITKLADKTIGDKIRQIPAVGQVDLVGERVQEVKIDLRPEALEQWHINPKDVVAAIRAYNRNDPAGQLKGKDRIWLLRSVSQAKNTADLRSIPVGKTPQGQPIFLEDIAEIYDGYAEINRVSRFGNKESNRPAVLLNILKQSGENTVEVSDRIRKSLDDIRKILPPDVEVTITRDNADLVRDNVADVYESLFIGAFLTVVVVLLFLRSFRSTITTGLSLPSSVITSFAVMYAAGFTVNVMTLLALSLSIGLLVDDAIVVRENIFRHLGDGDPKVAAEKGAKEVQLAVVATTFVIVAVFLPVGFMGGVSGQFFKQFALTVVFAVLVSLWDAMTMAPLLSAYFANIANPSHEWWAFGRVGRWVDNGLLKFEHFFDRIAKSYARLLHWLIPRPIVPAMVTVIALASAVGGFIALKKSFLPTQFGKIFTVSMQGPLAIPVDRVVEVANQAEKRIREVEGLENWTMNSGLNGTGYADISFTARVKEKYATSQDTLGQIRNDVRKALTGFPGYTTRISEPADPLAGTSGRFQPLAVIISGSEISKLNEVAGDIRKLIIETPGTTDVQQIQAEGLPEMKVHVDPLIAGQFGVSAQNIGDSLSTWVQGDSSNSMQIGDDNVPIRVRLKDGQKLSPNEVIAHNYYLKNGAKGDVGISIMSVTQHESGSGAALINRENRQRIVRVGANLSPGAALGDIVTDLQAKLDAFPFPQGYSARIAGQNEQMSELFSNVIWAIGIGSLFVYMVLVSLFESYVHPISVMAAIPLAATGAVLALLAFDLPLDLYGGVGMILLAGIVAKNSILLVEFAIQRVHENGETAREAILEAAPLRLRPIIMTSVAMIAGMVPVALGLGSGGSARRTLGVATIGGVVSSTFLTLLIVPSLYLGIDWLTNKFKNWRHNRRHIANQRLARQIAEHSGDV